jgi:hypothetical protein
MKTQHLGIGWNPAISEPLLPLPRNTPNGSSATADTVYRNYENALAIGTQGMERCDLIVCWVHNWPECPENLEVIEMSTVVKRCKRSIRNAEIAGVKNG